MDNTNQVTQLTIDTDTQSDDFKKLISTEKSSKIMFSGKFGSGKTTFIKSFFDDNEQEYQPIYLYPINYSVASNEDIFEYIKYDILSQLLGWKNISNCIDSLSSKLQNLYGQFITDPMKIIIPIVDALGKLGGDIGHAANIGKALFDLKTELDKIANDNNEGDQIHNFMSRIESQIGNIYQKDITTKIIKSILERFKEKNSQIKTVLIIDDLDRMDPDHIFRILNILAAHNDRDDENNNKFGFDKIITICDIHNIAHIYKNRYGSKADFKGYISKFYSEGIFHFSFKMEIIKRLKEIFETLEIEGIKSQSNPTEIKDDFKYDCFIPVLAVLIDNNYITIRDIVSNFNNSVIHANKYYRAGYLNFDLYNYEYIAWLYNFLLCYFPTKEGLYEAFSELNSNNEYTKTFYLSGRWNDPVNACLLRSIVRLLDTHTENKGTQRNFIYKEKIDISYTIAHKTDSPDKIMIKNLEELNNDQLPIWEMLLECFKKIDKMQKNEIKSSN